MSPNPSIDNLKKFTGQSSQLNSQLQAVLGNLDVQLDHELARYRRKKRAEAEAPQPSSHRSPRPGNPKNLELVVTPTPLEVPTKESPQPVQLDQRQPELSTSELMDRQDSATPESNLSPFSPQAALPQRLEATLSSSKQSQLDQSDRSIGNLAASDREQPNDYLESSEQLVGSLDRPSSKNLSTDVRKRRRRRSLKSLLSPLTVGVTLLFVLAVGTLAHIFSGKLADRTPVMTAENSGSSPTKTPLPEVPRSPNLADKEFVPLDLDTLGTLSGNTPKPTPTPTVPISPATPEIQNSATTPAAPNQNYPSLENINTAILPQSVQDNPQNSNPTNSQPSDSNNAATSPKPAANPETTATPTQPTVNAQSFPAFFYVLIPYQNDDNLFLARDVVPDAYVREFPIGVRIQMGAFEEAASAQKMVKYLKEQGLSAQVYQP